MELPHFRYHPEPLKTGSIQESERICKCCGQSRGYIYVGNVDAPQILSGELCPWCISDGSAAQKFEARFSDASDLIQEGVPREIVLEVSTRTPGFVSWQEELWQAHCSDACLFQGELSETELEYPAETARDELAKKHGFGPKWGHIARRAQKGEGPPLFKFVCRHCAKVIYMLG